MYGDDIGSLVIYTSTKANPKTEVQRLSGNKGNMWLKLNVDIATSLQTKEWLRIIVEGVVGKSYDGDISVDDITWSPNVTCLASDTTTTPGGPVIPITYRK